jgi:2'-5' RNA ligase
MPYLMPTHYIQVDFINLSIFEADDYDVLKFGCESKALDALHKATKHYFDNNWKWPEYSPHVTIAYVKKGTGKKYVQEPLGQTFKLVPSEYIFSNAEGESFQFDVENVADAGDSKVVM